jgi:hypothetical protein
VYLSENLESSTLCSIHYNADYGVLGILSTGWPRLSYGGWTQHDEEAELLLWQRRGPIGKLYNIIVWLGRSPQCRDKFNENVKELHPESVVTALVYGNDTRCGGDYDELVCALQHGEALKEFVTTALRYNLHGERDSFPTALKLDELHPEDWTNLTDIMQFLQPFRKW